MYRLEEGDKIIFVLTAHTLAIAVAEVSRHFTFSEEDLASLLENGEIRIDENVKLVLRQVHKKANLLN